MANYKGWAGKVLRVNLTTGMISSEDTVAKYKDFVGGEGLGLKVLWDEVPAGTHPYSAENKIIFGAGPLNGTGIPHAGRLSITTLLATNPFFGAGTGHSGGHFSTNLKFAGWDAVIVEGKAAHPVWICIQDDDVSIRDARKLWGTGTFRTTAAIMDEMGSDSASVCAIGQAGENLFGAATMLIDRSGSGQNGAPMGAKNLKAIGVRGTGAVKVACTGKQLMAQIAYHTSLCGGTSGGMTPKLPQPWAQFSGGEWTNGKNVWWGGADPAIPTGECDPHDVHTYAYRGPGNRSGWNSNERQMRWLVRANACFGCPVPCKQALHVPEMDTKWGAGARPCNECGGLSATRDYYGGTATTEAMFLGSVLADDYGIGDDYHILTGDLCYFLDNGILKANLPAAEYNSIPWNLRASGDPGFIRDLLRRFAFVEGELGKAFALGSYELSKRWNAPPLSQMLQERPYGKAVAWNETTWFAPHHFEGLQVGYLLNSMYNRDPCMHEQTHFNEFTTAIDKSAMAAVKFVESKDAVDAADQITPINDAKIRLAVRLSADGVLHNSLNTCNRGSSPWFSPLKERGYRGDSSLDSKEYSMVTGDIKTELEFMDTGLRIFNLMRALTIRSMNTKNMRVGHDVFPESGFNHPSWKTKKPFDKGSQRMDRADMDKALGMYYAAMGWDADGAPTRATYERLGLKYVADELATAGLL